MMRKAISVLMALALTLSLIGPAALASNIPSANVNPQQKGHVAYLESTYGKQRAGQILKGYGRAQEPPKPQHQIPNYITENNGIIIPQPGPSQPVWGALRVGDYFTLGGQRYVVSRITIVVGARILIAYPVNTYGIPDYMNPKYFYL